MVLKCKYCGKEIDGVLPAPLTCWACYKKHETDSEVSAHQEEVNIKSSGSPTKECEMCNRVLPIDHFYKQGNERRKICKDCVTEESAVRCLELLTIANIRKMTSTGITATHLVEQTGRVRSGIQTMLNDLVKTNRAHKKIILGEHTFFMDSKLADELIEEKRASMPVGIQKKSEFRRSEDIKVSDEGIWIKNVPIIKLDSILEEIRSTMDPDFSLNIKTEGEYADIFLSDDQMINWARMSFKHIIGSFLDR